MRPFVLPLKNFRNPKEFQCLGFNLTDLDVLIRKGYLQINAAYMEVDASHLEHCGIFERALRNGPLANF